MKKLIVILVAVLATACATTGVKLAEQAAPQTVLFADVTTCLKAAIDATLTPTAAAEFCLEARRLEADRAKATAEAAAKAEANKPACGLCLMPGTGYGYYNTYPPPPPRPIGGYTNTVVAYTEHKVK
ncbi:MAG: hypothetical protein WCT44_03235 [Candidatus Paceibacterota bacterium]